MEASEFQQIPKFIINRLDSTVRLNHARKQLEKVQMSNFLTIIEAKKPDNQLQQSLFNYISEQAYENIHNLKSTRILPNLKSVALTKSHREIWKYVIDNNLNHAIIMEDDVEITDQFLFNKECSYLSEIIKTLPFLVPMYVIFNGSYSVSKVNDLLYQSYLDTNYDSNNIVNYAVYDHSKYPNFKYFPSNNNVDILGCHFYYINKEMAKVLYNNLKMTTYQLDIEISKLASTTRIKDRCTFLNVETKSIIQSRKFISEIQFYVVDQNELSNILKLPLEICKCVLDYYPKCLKKN